MMGTGKRILTFISVWCLLFLGVVSVRELGASGENGNVAETQSQILLKMVKELKRLELTAQPMRTSAHQSIGQFPKIEQELPSQIRTATEKIRGCVRRPLYASTGNTQYIEISFGTSDIGKLHEVVIERSTMAMTFEEEACLSGAFEEFRVPAGVAVHERIRYPFCITQRADET